VLINAALATWPYSRLSGQVADPVDGNFLRNGIFGNSRRALASDRRIVRVLYEGHSASQAPARSAPTPAKFRSCRPGQGHAH
jgi:hypothetical protein